MGPKLRYPMVCVPFIVCACIRWCMQPPPPLVTMRRWAIASAVIYAVGIPATFAYVLFKHRKEIQADQTLRTNGYGNSRAQNPNFAVRQRYQKLYRYCDVGVVILPMFSNAECVRAPKGLALTGSRHQPERSTHQFLFAHAVVTEIKMS